MSYEFKGTVRAISQLLTFPSGFSKKSVVVENTDGKYPNVVSIDFAKEKANLLDAFAPGDEVVVQFDLRGREYNNKFYHDLAGWRIEKAGSVPASVQQQARPMATGEAVASDNDLPF